MLLHLSEEQVLEPRMHLPANCALGDAIAINILMHPLQEVTYEQRGEPQNTNSGS
jgi:hypothetical protein